MLLKRRHIISWIAAFAAIALSHSCSSIDIDFTIGTGGSQKPAEHVRNPNNEYLNVFLLYSCGYNDLSSALKQDIKDITSNLNLGNSRNALLVFAHGTASRGDYRTESEPTLCRYQKNEADSLICDTLKVWPGSCVSASGEMLADVLTLVKDMFPASVYGMLFSSHGSGWTPTGYIRNPYTFEGSGDGWGWMSIIKPDDDKPAVKSAGIHARPDSKHYEIDIQDFADAIPMKLDYLIFDACLMGGVEVAYQLRGKCDKLVASQAEILADGMDYQTMCSYIFASKWPDLEGLCRRYYDYYNNQSSWKSATISIVDCNKLEPLAEVCREIFETNREGIAGLEGAKADSVQMYFREADRTNLQWFYDLEDIVLHCEASQEQKDNLRNALDECVLYKMATEKILDSTPVKHHCGLSMYLPFKNKTYLNNFYKTLDWNLATGLVE
jgi:hypothetical protein